GRHADPAALEAAIHGAVLERDVAELERGLETLVGPRGVRLSGGQLQRAAAARMLVAEAELLVVDDLSSALDVETEATLWQRLLARPGVTCLAVSHRRAALRRADRIVVLREGRVDDQGRLEELLGRCAELRRLWSGEPDAPAGVPDHPPAGEGVDGVARGGEPQAGSSSRAATRPFRVTANEWIQPLPPATES
ncbi:MAG TPA: ABC transporter ATP-binding protein, partial [Chloroflexota bacterium]|nr:ABC transporter ATP-binding protein [Chloroflexota bacterium]